MIMILRLEILRRHSHRLVGTRTREHQTLQALQLLCQPNYIYLLVHKFSSSQAYVPFEQHLHALSCAFSLGRYGAWYDFLPCYYARACLLLSVRPGQVRSGTVISPIFTQTFLTKEGPVLPQNIPKIKAFTTE